MRPASIRLANRGGLHAAHRARPSLVGASTRELRIADRTAEFTALLFEEKVYE